MIIRRLCHICSSVFGKRNTAGLSRHQFAKYSRYSEHDGGEIDQDLDYKGTISWLQFIVNEDGDRFLANLSEEKLKEKVELELLMDLWRAEGEKMIPDALTRNDWKILLKDRDTIEKKLMYLELVYRRQGRRKEKAEIQENILKSITQPHDDSDLNMIQKTVDMRKHLDQWNGLQSLQYGRPLVIDMDYEVNEHETFSTFKQIEIMYSYNCRHIQPCHLHFTSSHKNKLMERMLGMGRNMSADFYRDDLLEVFPKKRLFYLVPEGPEVREEQVKADQIFVLGGLASTKERRRSYAKAVSLGIPCGSIPLHRFVSLKQRSTIDLHLPVVLNILLDKFTGDSWKKTLDTHLPDKIFQKYPGLVGPVPHKQVLKSYKQFNKLCQILKIDKK